MGVTDIVTGIVKGVAGSAGDLVKTFRGSQQERDQQSNERFLAGQKAFSAEFQSRTNRTWWDSFWDGFNRMPRPVIVVLVLAYFILSYFNPTEFQVLNVSLDTVPERMWWVLSAIVGFYFMAREFQKSRDSRMALSKADFSEVQRRVTELRSSETAEPAKTKAPWYQIAKDEMARGVFEIKGAKDHNPRIVEYHSATVLNATNDETPWCSAFVNWCMRSAGILGTGSAMARSWLEWGEKIETPVEGCVVVFSRGNVPIQGHVGFFVRFDGDYVLTLGGNQSDSVCMSRYHMNRVLGFRWPKDRR